MECRNCRSTFEGTYCSNCGHPAQPPRIDLKYVLEEIGNVVSFKKGILFTIRELLLRPGRSVNNFILHDRNRLVKPVLFTIFCSFVYTVLQQMLHFEDGYITYSSDSEASSAMLVFQWIQGNYGYANILMAVFVAWWAKLLFRKYKYNYFEILILILFVFGMTMLIYSVLGVLEAVTHLRVLHLAGLIGFVYASWAMGQFFEARKIGSYLKGLLSYMLGFLSFIFISLVLAILFDTLIGT